MNMKKLLSPEIKIALVAIVGIVVLFFGMNFLKGLNLYSSEIRWTDLHRLRQFMPMALKWER